MPTINVQKLSGVTLLIAGMARSYKAYRTVRCG